MAWAAVNSQSPSKNYRLHAYRANSTNALCPFDLNPREAALGGDFSSLSHSTLEPGRVKASDLAAINELPFYISVPAPKPLE